MGQSTEDPAAPLHRESRVYIHRALFKMLVWPRLDTVFTSCTIPLDQTSWLVEGYSLNNAYSTEPEISHWRLFGDRLMSSLINWL